MRELTLLQAARLKGRLQPDAAAACAGLSVAEAEVELAGLRDAGLLQGEKALRITPAGRERLAALLSAERASLDADALSGAYHEFDSFNTSLKEIVTAWQLKSADLPNDHTDPAYDAMVIDRLCRLHDGFVPFTRHVSGLVPRLLPYPNRFDFAIEQVRAGDHSWVARPIADSYHTVWFEFHEELIGLLGLSRQDEALAGRAV